MSDGMDVPGSKSLFHSSAHHLAGFYANRVTLTRLDKTIITLDKLQYAFPFVQVVVALFDTSSFTTLARLPTGTTSLNQLTWLSDGRTLLAATADGRLMKWQGIAPPPATPLSQQRLLTPGGFEAADIGASQLCGGGGDAGGECMTVSSRRAACRCFAVDEQREFIAAGGPDGMLRLWPLHWQVRPWAPRVSRQRCQHRSFGDAGAADHCA